MTLEECYEELGGNYQEVCARLPSPRLVEKFIARFPDDKIFESLCAGIGEGNREEAFRAAHTLKGVCANLSFTRLCGSASRLTEELRPEEEIIPESCQELLEKVQEDYRITVDAIRKYMRDHQL